MSLRTNAKVTLAMDGAECVPVPKEKTLTHQSEKLSKREKRLIHKHKQWKTLIKEARQDLKSDLSDEDLAALADTLKQRHKDLVNDYDDIRSCVTPSPGLTYKIEACDAVFKELMKILSERMAGAKGECGVQRESLAIHQLLNHNNPQSINGTAPRTSAGQSQARCSLAGQRVEAADELAAKAAQSKLMQEEQMQKENIEQQMKELQLQTLQCLQAERDMQAARATLEVYDRKVNHWNRQVLLNPLLHHRSSFPVSPFPINSTPLPLTDVCYLAKAIQDGIAKNGLLMSEPTLFSGDPNHFIEWKESFMSLIDKKDISGAAKLNYLKKYVTGPAYKCLEGSFNQNDDDAYREAWEELNRNYGQKVAQRAFGEKLSKWPKILSKDGSQSVAKHSTIQTQMNGKPRPRRPCILCKDHNHQLGNCSEFMKGSLDDRRIYVKDHGLCYGCLKPGHTVKECQHRHTCDLCKGRHPNCLHDKNYRKVGAKKGKGAFYQSAFIEKLSKWPKIKPKDIEGLRAFADFLHARLRATPHVKFSEILSESKENQMLLQKIPQWLESRWNRQVSEALMNGGDLPTFADFTRFVSREAEMASNPVTSIHAVPPSDQAHEKSVTREIKVKRAIIFRNQTAAKSNSKHAQINGKLRPPRPCTLCKNNNHQLHNCSEFMKSSLDDRRLYVKDYWLCYGCLKPGHSVKECRRRHTCDLCNGRHPTCLHDENYRKDAKKRSADAARAAPRVARAQESHSTP